MIGYDEVAMMVRGAVDQIAENHETLSRLDSHGGDGDHGSTMLRAMRHLEKAVNETTSRNVKEMLQNVGWAIMGVDGGATGPLFGMFFIGMSEAAEEKDSFDAADVAAMCVSGLASIQKQTKAQVGDKTMLDALVPAVEALRAAADRGADVATALAEAAGAAETGAESTRELQARFGRARNLGERSVGHQDPGATSVSLIFKGFCEGV